MSAQPVIQEFAPPRSSSVDVLFVAGEHSGDQHAANLIRSILAKQPELRIAAVGGPEMEKAGAQLLFDLTSFSVVGLVEVLKHISQFKKLHAETVGWISKYKPKAVCFVDYPGFNLRVAKALSDRHVSRKSGGSVALYYYISPQIWAWKARRRFEMARLLDSLAVIFPFEVGCYADTSLNVQFVGHPFVTEGREANLSYDPAGSILLLPGSRVQPVLRIFPAMLAGFQNLLSKCPEEKAVVLYPDALIRATLERVLSRFPKLEGRVELRSAERGAAAKACLISSGTMSLNCALAGIPGAVCYKAHPLTYALGRMLVNVTHLGIANLLMPDNPPYPEFLQGDASAEKLGAVLQHAIEDNACAAKSMEAATSLKCILSAGDVTDPATWLMRGIE
jgi:lipid-A-disaccharide synthase